MSARARARPPRVPRDRSAAASSCSSAWAPRSLLAQDRRRGYPDDFNAYLRIGEDGRVTVFSGKIEMGQGVMTSQAQMVAEELGVALESVDMVLGDTDRCPWDMGTFGSLTTRMFGPALRAAGAEARAVLAAAGVREARRAPKEKLVVANGVVSVAGRSGTQGDATASSPAGRRSRARSTRRRCCARSPSSR